MIIISHAIFEISLATRYVEFLFSCNKAVTSGLDFR